MNYARYAVVNARHLPDKVCLIERTPSKNQRRTLTWKQFNDEINRVANYLTRELGVKDGDFVMHLQNNSLEWLITYYGIIKTGAVIVPLNFRFVGPDILYAAEVCNPKVFILGSEFVPVVLPVRKDLKTVKNYICVGDSVPEEMIDYKTIAAYKDTEEAIVDVEDQHDLAMMFTSGTTGKPKAVMHTHYSLNNTAIGNGMSYFVEKNDNYVFFLPLYHSGTLFLWAPFYATGATGTILRELTDPKWIMEAIEQEKGTDILFVVPVAVMVLNAIKSGQLKLSDYDLSSLKYLEIGAQPVPFEIMKGLVDHFPCAVSNIYGITEGGGGGTFNLYPEDVLRKPGSIGKPTFGVEGKIVDFDGKDLPPGQVGELIFTTNRMMKGYYKNPELTADSLKNGWLYTGDLLQTDDEGYFYIVDRKKDMITSGGENIFPVEIEAALMQSPKIDDAACIGYPDDRLVEIVMAIVQVKQGQTMTEEEVLDFCKQVGLAKYKWPRKTAFDKVMRNPTGKLMKPQMREKFTGRKEAFKKLD
jgi:acyl-CoA synthetase (AMP-forming)/AMP-acid ligase II